MFTMNTAKKSILQTVRAISATALVLFCITIAPQLASAAVFCDEEDCYPFDEPVASYYDGYYSNMSNGYNSSETGRDTYCDEYEDGYDCVHYVYTNKTNTVTQSSPAITFTYPTYTAPATTYPVYYPVQSPVYVPVAQPVFTPAPAKRYVTVTTKPTKQNGFVVKRTYAY
jgi:hypothetical protein